jgi:hypothetical protein
MPNIPFHEHEDYTGHLHKNFNVPHPVHSPEVPEEQPVEENKESNPE